MSESLSGWAALTLMCMGFKITLLLPRDLCSATKHCCSRRWRSMLATYRCLAGRSLLGRELIRSIHVRNADSFWKARCVE